MTALCENCSTQEQEIAFSTVKQLFEHKKSGHKLFDGIIRDEPLPSPPQPPTANEKKAEATPIPPKAERKPIVLEYKYSGTCEICSMELDTILFSITEDLQAVTAYCSKCKKQYTQRRVIPIDKQKIGEEKKGKEI